MGYYRIISYIKKILLAVLLQRKERLVCLLLAFASLTPIFSVVPLGASSSRLDLRDALIKTERQNINEIMKKKLQNKAIGEWQAIIDDSLFSLIRRTELYRGKVGVVVYEDDVVALSILPDFSVFISSGLLGYIDEAIFLSLSDNLRRAKNINEERELYLSAFLAFEVARVALDIDVSKYQNTPTLTLRELSQQLLPIDFFLIDEMAASLLKIAGYSSNLMVEHLERLKETVDGSFVSSYSFDEFLLKNVDARRKRILEEKESIEHLAEEVLSVLFALNSQEALGELVQSIELLETSYPSSLYLLRLKTLTRHSLYLESVARTTKREFVPFLPTAVLGHTYAKRYYLPLDENITEPNSSNVNNSGQCEVFRQGALSLYREYLETIRDESMASSYLALVGSLLDDEANNDKKKETAQTILAEKDVITASTLLQDNADLLTVEKINYAFFTTLLKMNSKENDVATERNAFIAFLKSALSTSEENATSCLKKGHFFDERLILYNYIVASSVAHKKREELNSSITLLKSKSIGTNGKKTLNIRRLKIGASTDELTQQWGEPSSIVYNYYFERWIYNHLKAMAVISSYAENPAVIEIILFSKSPASLQGNIRVGDNRKTLEAQLGSPSYKAGDCDVYFYGRESICTLYSSENIIKSISIFRSILNEKE